MTPAEYKDLITIAYAFLFVMICFLSAVVISTVVMYYVMSLLDRKKKLK